MRPGPHAATDGSFGRSAGMAAGRGALLLGIAVMLGIVLLNAADDAPGTEVVATDDLAEPTTTEFADEETPTTVALRAPRDVKVLAANGTRVKGAATRVKETLRIAGYNVLAPTDAPGADATTVYFVSGYQREAEAIATALGLAVTAVAPMPTPAPISDVGGAHALVIVGPDLAGTTTTTAPPRTSTTAARTSTTAARTSTTARSSTTRAGGATTTTTR